LCLPTPQVLATQSPHAGGLYLVEHRYHKEAPLRPASLRFLTPVLHPRVASDGSCSWEPGVAHTVVHDLMLLFGILSEAEVTR
jgi:ubiquitin-protein ligase